MNDTALWWYKTTLSNALRRLTYGISTASKDDKICREEKINAIWDEFDKLPMRALVPAVTRTFG